jgi:hypothetical protein
MTATSRCQCGHPDDHARLHRSWSAAAEAGGFEPPVPLSTLAFKIVDPAITGDRPSSMGRSSARACSLPGRTDRERMQPQMPPLQWPASMVKRQDDSCG